MNNITVYLRKDYKRTDNLYPVYCMVSIKRQKVRFNTKVYCSEADWDASTSSIRGKSKEVKDSNLIIQKTVGNINDVFVRYRLMNREVTPAILTKEFENPSTYVDWFDFMKKLMSSKKGNNAENTIKTHQTLYNNLEEYLKYLSKKKQKITIDIADIDEDFIGEFKKWLKRQGNNLNTIEKKMRIFKIYTQEAIRRKQMAVNPFAHIRIKQVEAYREFLDPDELKLLVAEYRKPNKIKVEVERNALRCFLFSCFTGLRISDLRAVKMEHVVKDNLVFIPQKSKNLTNKTLRIPLTKPALMLIKDAGPLRLYGQIFTMETDQKMNKRIKDICALLNISKNLSFHCGRHTFATIFLREGGKLHILQKLMGHANIQETMKYVHILPDDTEEEMLVFDRYY